MAGTTSEEQNHRLNVIQNRSRLPLAYNPLIPALYRSVRAGVKKHSMFMAREVVGLDDLRSAEKGERPVGVPAARGHGVMEV